MTYKALISSLFLAVLSSLCGLESTFAQVGIDSTPVTKKTRDTIVIIKRDTVVVIQKETVKVIDKTSQESNYDARATTLEERENIAEQRRRLRDERRREYEEWYNAQPVVRTGNSWGYKFYPTALGQIDFPSVKFGIERTFAGISGIQATLGLLTKPIESSLDGNIKDAGEARFGLRGIDIGLSGRYYLSDVKKRFPFYLELETSFAIAPVQIGLWSTSEDGSFQQYLEVPVNGEQFYFGFITGWELRTKEGILLDLATGFRIGTKSINSSNSDVQDLLQDKYWNLNPNGSVPMISLVTRIGIGYGKWEPIEVKKRSSKSKSRKRRR